MEAKKITEKERSLARKCIAGLTQYAAERRLGFESHQTGNAGLNPERREERSRKLIRGLAEHYGLGEEAQSLVERFDKRIDGARRSSGIEILSATEQRETVHGLLAYAKSLAGDQIAKGRKDNREQVLAVSDHFEDMASCLSWDVSALGLHGARDWIDHALPRLTAWDNILFTRILLGGEIGPNGSDFAGGAVTEANEIATLPLFERLCGQYPEIAEWPAVCTVYRGGYTRGTPHDATEVDLEIMRRCGDGFVDIESISVCRFPEQITVPRELLPPTYSAELDAKTERKLAEYVASEEFISDCGYREMEYRHEGKHVPSSEEIKAEVMAGARETIRFQLECEDKGHEFADHADPENGRGTVECERCGYSWDYQW